MRHKYAKSRVTVEEIVTRGDEMIREAMSTPASMLGDTSLAAWVAAEEARRETAETEYALTPVEVGGGTLTPGEFYNVEARGFIGGTMRWARGLRYLGRIATVDFLGRPAGDVLRFEHWTADPSRVRWPKLQQLSPRHVKTVEPIADPTAWRAAADAYAQSVAAAEAARDRREALEKEATA